MLDEAIIHARRHFIESYVGLGLALKGLNSFRTGLTGSTLVPEGLALLAKSNYEVFHPFFLTDFARLRAQSGAYMHDGEIGALLEIETGQRENWTSAEVKRNLGEILLLRGEPVRAARLFADAADCADRQGALSWRLRTALSRAQSETGSSSQRQARKHLENILQKFTEGRKTADVQAAYYFLENSLN